jgi:outer membrane protein assembly factor BamB
LALVLRLSRLLVALGVATSVCVAQENSDERLWVRKFADKITTFGFTTLGSLVLQTRGGMVAIDPVSGRDLWSAPDISAYQRINGTPFAMAVRANRTVVLDLETGRTLWHIGRPPLIWHKGYIHVPQRGLLLVYGQTATRGHVIVASNYATGAVAWRQEDLYSTGPLADEARDIEYSDRQPALVDDRMIVLDPTHDGLVALDVDTGRLLWRIPELVLKEPGAIAEGSARMRVDGDRLFIPVKKTIVAVGVADGAVLWTHKKDFPAAVTQMVVTPHGLLVRGGAGNPYLALLDPATGDERWSTITMKKLECRSAFVIRGDTLLVGLREGVAVMDVRSGTVLKAVTLSRFQGGEDPRDLEVLDDGRVLLSSNQNLRLVDLNGRVYFDRYFKAPGPSLFAKIAGTVFEAALITSAVVYRTPYTPTPLLTASLVARYEASVRAQQYVYMFTSAAGEDGREGVSLVRINKETGNEVGRVWFSDRSPNFRFDPVSGVAIVAEDNLLHASRFPGFE